MKERKRPYDMTARAAQVAATRARILASAVKFYSEQPIEDFTLDAVAAEAGTTVRTVLRAFGSKDELVYAALVDLSAKGVPVRPTPPGDVDAAVEAMFDIYEGIGDLVIRRLNDEARRPVLAPVIEMGRDGHRVAIDNAFAPQLARTHGAARAQLFNALLVATDVYVWKLLRRDLTLGRAAAEAIMRKLVRGALGGGDGDGENSVAQLVRRRQPAA